MQALEGVEGRAVYGLTGEELAAFSDELDLLVVGSRSYGPFKRLVLGSTSDYLERHARCSLLVLPRCRGAADGRTSAGAEPAARAGPRDARAARAAEGAGETEARAEAAATRMIRIVLADDHAVVRSGLRMVLDSESDLEVVAEASDVDSARALRARPPPGRARARPEHARRLEPRGDPADPRGVARHPDRRPDDAAGAGLRPRGARRRARSATCSRRPPTTSSSKRSAARRPARAT